MADGHDVNTVVDLGEATHEAVLDRLLSVEGMSLADVGCGAGATSEALAERGAEVLGVEPDPVQAAKNRAKPPLPGLRFVEGHAEDLPLDNGTTDGVFYFFSLHHVPPERMDAALAEALRVLKPGTGFLYVAEPAMSGSYFPLGSLFNDETEVRTLALAALGRLTQRFERHEQYQYSLSIRYADFAAFVAQVVGATYNDIGVEKVDRPEVRAIFETGRAADGYVFEQPTILNLFRRPRG